MRVNLIIVDDFYSNPDEVRQFALNQEFKQRESFPGPRTQSFINQGTKDTLQNIIFNYAGKVTDWNDRDGLTGSFEMEMAKDRSWIHTDHFNTWAGVVYLTPDAPLEGGTAFYKHKRTGATKANELQNYESNDITKWEVTDIVANRYNRLVLYHSDLFHNRMHYFGNTPETARLFQLFFLTTEY